MSWLYERRYQFDGLRPLIEIAHWVAIFRVPPEDEDDVEQEIVIYLIQTVEKYGDKGKNYLFAVARHRLYEYFRKKYKEKRPCYILESDKGEIALGAWVFLHDGDADARLDAKATLATLPKRLIQIGHKVLDGEKLSKADKDYRISQKAKLRPTLNCPYTNRLSDWEKRRILQLHSKGVSMCKIATTMGRSNVAVMTVLAGRGLSRQDWLAKMEMVAKEKEELIRHAYFVEGKSFTRITQEFHTHWLTVRKAILGGNQEKGGAAGTV